MKRKLKKSHLFIILLFCILVFTSLIFCMLNRSTRKTQDVETVEKPYPIFVKNSEYEPPKKEETSSFKLVGYLTIEKIGLLSQPVWEGVEDNVLGQGIGHFRDTALLDGNIRAGFS